MGVELQSSLYALDSTTILCLSLFRWAKFRKHKAAGKMHTLLNLHGNIPTSISITGGKVHDVNILDAILPEAGGFYASVLHSTLYVTKHRNSLDNRFLAAQN